MPTKGPGASTTTTGFTKTCGFFRRICGRFGGLGTTSREAEEFDAFGVGVDPGLHRSRPMHGVAVQFSGRALRHPHRRALNPAEPAVLDLTANRCSVVYATRTPRRSESSWTLVSRRGAPLLPRAVPPASRGCSPGGQRDPPPPPPDPGPPRAGAARRPPGLGYSRRWRGWPRAYDRENTTNRTRRRSFRRNPLAIAVGPSVPVPLKYFNRTHGRCVATATRLAKTACRRQRKSVSSS